MQEHDCSVKQTQTVFLMTKDPEKGATSPMSSVTVRAATASDVPRIAAIHYAALNQYHEFYAAFFAAHPRDTLPVSIERAFHSRNTAFLVAEDAQTQSVLGFVRWKVLDPTAAVAPGVSGGGGSTVPSLFRMKDYLDEVWKRFAVKDDEMEACYEGAAGGEKHYCEFFYILNEYVNLDRGLISGI